MGEPTPARPVKLICGILAARSEWLDKAVERLAEELGPVGLVSETWPFECTDYYADEMGENLLRRFCSFEELIAPERIVDVKLRTNRMEREMATAWPESPERPVNLDPGYVGDGKLVLATTKDYAHRIYLGRGIWAEVTLRWRGGEGFCPWEWTYPDYRSAGYGEFFARVRERLMGQRRGARPE